MKEQAYYIPQDGKYHWNKESFQWERLDRVQEYKGCIIRSITYHSEWNDPMKIRNHREYRITFPDGHEGWFGSFKKGGSLKELKDFIDFKEKYGKL